jgi:hypothetical protein
VNGSQAPDLRRSPLPASTLIRTLAAWGGSTAPVSETAFAQRVSQWFDWTHEIALAAVLSARPDPAVPGAPPLPGVPLEHEARELARLRAVLQKAADDAPDGISPQRDPREARAARRPAAAPSEPTEIATDFATSRQRYHACQQLMETRIAALRRRLRAALADQAPALAQLAELDQLMEQVVGEQERVLLASLGGRLEARFEQSRQQRHQQECQPLDKPPVWLPTFQHEMRALLRAELDLRLQPLDGLLEAGRQPSSAQRP